MNDTTQATTESKYDTCKACGAEAVRLMTSGDATFFGDMADESEYDPDEDEVVESDVRLGGHICLECENIQEVWIEYPYHGDDERILNWLKEEWSQRLGIGPAHELSCRVHLGEDLREVAKELMRGEK